MSTIEAALSGGGLWAVIDGPGSACMRRGDAAVRPTGGQNRLVDVR